MIHEPGKIDGSVGRARARLAHRDRPQLRVRREPPVQRAQERPSLSLVVLPGVLAVEDDEDGRLSPAGRRLNRRPASTSRRTKSRPPLRRPGGVREPDQVRERVVAEPAGDVCLVRPNAVRPVQQLRLLDMPVPVAREALTGVRARISSSVAIHRKPARATSGTIASDTDPSDGQRPPGGAEQPLVQRHGARQLLGRILGMPERLARHPGMRMGAQVDVRVAQQRQNRVIERRRRELDLAALGRRPVFGNDPRSISSSTARSVSLSSSVKPAVLRNQRAARGRRQPK